MKKKIVLFGVALATLATFNSCTSENDIAETPVPEQPTVVSGDPITFTATMNDDGTTRAAVASNLNGFTLWGVQNGAVSTTATGLAYSYNSTDATWQAAEAPSYDTGDSPVPYYFYALASGNSQNKANAITFGDDGNSTNTEGTVTIKGSDSEETPLLLTDGAYNAKSFTYTMPTNGNYLNLDKQEDLLVAHNFGTEDAGWTTGTVPLTFDHALANIELNVALPQSTWDTETDNYVYTYDNISTSGVFAVVSSITIHGLKKTGTYTFGTGWSHPSGNGEIKFEYPNGLFIFGKFFDLPEDETQSATIKEDATARRKYERTYYDPIATGTNIMVVPQEFTPWSKTNSIENSNNQCYIEIEAEILFDAVTATESEEAWNDGRKAIVKAWVQNWTLYGGSNAIALEDTEEGKVQLSALTDFGSDPANKTEVNKFYIPFAVSSNALLQNKRYKFYIDLYHLLDANGSPALDFWNP